MTQLYHTTDCRTILECWYIGIHTLADLFTVDCIRLYNALPKVNQDNQSINKYKYVYFSIFLQIRPDI